MNKLLPVILLTTLISTVACAFSPLRQVGPPVNPVIEFTSDTTGFDTHTYFFVGDDGVVAIGAQFTPELARQAIAKLRTVTSKPIRYVVITHPNPDKFNGVAEFQKLGAQVIASDATTRAIPGVHAYKKAFFVGAKMFTDATYPAEARVDQTFTGQIKINVGPHDELFLRELSQPGVSSTQTVVFAPSANALFVGDLVHHQVHAWLEGGIVGGKPVPTLSGWKTDLREIQSSYPNAMVYGGRGVSGIVETVAPEQIRYLDQAAQLVSQYARDLKSTTSQPDFAVLQKRFETAMPTYGLGYLIQYGAYGLFGMM